jgi:hypothetical protein
MSLLHRELEHIRRKQREFLDLILVKKWTRQEAPPLEIPEDDHAHSIRRKTCMSVTLLAA